MTLTEKLQELKQIAGKATPAPWAVYGTADQHVRTNVGASEFRLYKIKHRGDAAHIAAFHPEVARAFVEAIRTIELIGNHARVCIVSTEEECDMSANWVERRCNEALAKLSAALGCEK